MKYLFLILVSALACSTVATAAKAKNSQSNYYGNVTASGGGVCSAISGTFPAILGYQYTSAALTPTLVVVKILIQNNSINPPLLPQYIIDFLTPTDSSGNGGTVNTQDPQLLGSGTTLSGVNGTYTGTALPDQGVGAYFSLNSVILTSQFNGATCTVKLNGVLYFSP